MGVIKNKKWFFIFLLPGLLFYILSVFYPIEESIRLSFMEWNGIGDKTFAGLQNYVTMFHDPTFYKSFLNNLIYLLVVVVMQLGIGLIFAVLLTFMKKHVTFVKTLYYVPCIITTVAIAQLFRSMYATEPMGLINQFFSGYRNGRNGYFLAGKYSHCTCGSVSARRLEIYRNVYGYFLCSVNFA